MKQSTLLENRYFLYATEFFSGMSVMAVELGASRLMAPYFSSSQIVWTVIIGVIMIALAIGSLWGGRMADKDPDPSRLYLRLLIAAVWICLIPFLGRFLILGISLLLAIFITQNLLIWAALFTCLVIFAFPCVLLGTVTPSLVKYTTQSLTNNGKTMGELSALNTIGSIIGTFLPTFVTIPAVGTAASFLIFSGVLLAIALVYFFSIRKRLLICLAALVIFNLMVIATPFISFAFWEKDVMLEDESIYNYLQVKEDEDSVMLSTNVMFGVQSILMKHDTLTGMYYDYALAAPLMASHTPPHILILGMGTGTFAKSCTEYFPDASIEGVEIDQKIADLAVKYFELPENVTVSVYDGRSYLRNSKQSYDVIMVDAYQDITIPFQMSSIEFFREVSSHLTENGIMVVNMNMRSTKENSINDYLCDTIHAVFPYVYTAPVKGGTNCEVFAAKSGDALFRFEENRSKLSDPKLSSMMNTVAAQLKPWEGEGRILTDDKAPVELLGMKVLDEMIGEEIDYYRKAYLGNLLK
ncbi:hypothetical protein FACS1894111_11930 [Clostridia bacterium]|nr:hypothetical protein FACS1894111_11930 [Clostridia bacterium]